jgi:general secretion pathway protein G
MKRPSRSSARRGFTLVEMLVVLGILVFLASMVLPRMLGAQKKADIQGAQTQIGILKTALTHYSVDCKNYPTSDQGLQALLTAPDGVDAWKGPYLDSDALPKDPWNHDYQYAYPPTHGSTGDRPDIWSFGPDGQDGTDDDITSWTTAGGSGSGSSSSSGGK